MRPEIITVAKKAADVWRGTDTYHQAAQIIDMLVSELEGEPTPTPQNESLTCDGCDMQGEKITPCESCIRDPRVCDYYTRRPPKRQADTNV